MIYPAMQLCDICPRHCRVDRYKQTGFCGAPAELVVNMHTLHHGEEPSLSGTRGSGTIFFSWCNLRCVFCQNYDLSVLGWGHEISYSELSQMMLDLQQSGAHNINLVTPTHYTPQIVEAIKQAKENGLTIPLVWNSSSYEKVSTLQMLEGLIDIYLPDYKYAHGVYAHKYSSATDYPATALAAVKEMNRQVGTLQSDAEGIAVKGLIIRLLVLPEGLSGTRKTLRTIAEELGTQHTLSIMGQYYPAGDASKYPELQRGITELEYNAVVDAATELGFSHLYTQELSCSDTWTPNFELKSISENLQTPNFNPFTEQNS